MLFREGLIECFIVETGKLAKKRKLKRMITQRPRWALLLLPLDIAFLLYMTWKANRLFYKRFPVIPQPKVDLLVDDANEESCIEYLKREQPDILLIYGTAILKDPVLSIPKICALNIHGGIVPKYRNVHGEFWAVAKGKFEELGTSILVMDRGIDSGDVVSQRTLGIRDEISVSTAKLVVFEETLKLVREVIEKARLGTIPRKKQEGISGAPFQTPTFGDWVKHRLKL